MSDPKLRAEWFWTDRWIQSTAFLLPIEARGLYREMLTRAWGFGGYLPADFASIRRLVNVTEEEWDRCWPLVKQYWKQDGSKLTNATQLEVLRESLSLSEKRALAGRKGGKASGKARSKPQANPQAKGQANPKQTKPLSLSPSQEQEKDVSVPSEPRRTSRGYPPGFDRWWKAFPAGNSGSKGSKKKAAEYWKRDRLESQVDELTSIVASFAQTRQWQEGFIPYPQKFLNERRYESPPEGSNGKALPPGHFAHGRKPGDHWEMILDGEKRVELVWPETATETSRCVWRNGKDDQWRTITNDMRIRLSPVTTS